MRAGLLESEAGLMARDKEGEAGELTISVETNMPKLRELLRKVFF